MSFGYSLSDVALGIKIVGTAISALKESDGASSEFQELMRDLVDLQRILQSIQAARERPVVANSDSLDQIAARAKVSATRIDTFLDQVRKFENALGQPSKWNNAIPRKLQWALLESMKVRKFYKRIGRDLHIISALQQNILMYVHLNITWQLADCTRESAFRSEGAIREPNAATTTSEKSLTMVNVTAQSEARATNPGSATTPHTLRDGADSLTSTMQDTFMILQQTISDGFAEQQIMLRDLAALQDQATLHHRQPQGPIPLPLESSPIPPKSHKSFLVDTSPGCTAASRPGLFLNIASTTSNLSARDRSPADSRPSQRNTCSELYDRSRSLSASQCSSCNWLVKYANAIRAFAHRIKHLFWIVLTLDSRLLALYVALQTQIPQTPSSHSSVRDSIRLIDAFGKERRLQYATHRHFPVFKAFITEDYKDTPCGPYIARNRYRLLDMSASRLTFLTEASWSNTVRPGCIVTLSIALRKLPVSEGGNCPGCGNQKEWMRDDSRYDCICGLTYYRSRNHGMRKSERSGASEISPLPTSCSSRELDQRPDVDSMGNEEQSLKTPSQDEHDLATDLEGHHMRIFQRIIFQRSSKSQKASLYCTFISATHVEDLVQRLEIELVSNSKFYTLMRADLLKTSGAKSAAILSLQADAIGTLWLWPESPHWLVSVNDTPLCYESTSPEPKTSSGRQLSEGDSVLVKDLRPGSSIMYHHRVVHCHRRPKIGNYLLWDLHNPKKTPNKFSYISADFFACMT